MLNRLFRHYPFLFSKRSQKNPLTPSVSVDPEFNRQKIIHIPNKNLPTKQKRNILITSALPYVNNTPHLGNIIGAVLSADVYARFCRLMGYNVLFICGTDEYGTATEIKALQQKTTPKQICDSYHKQHRDIYNWFDISFDHFGRTSNQIHTKITQQIFLQIQKNGHFKPKEITQFYCNCCKMFLADRYITGKCKKCNQPTRGDQCDCCSTVFENPIEDLSDPHCQVCGTMPTPKETNHLFFSFQKSLDKLKKWLLQENQMQGWQNNAKGMTKSWVNSPLHDRCMTRDLKWGVKVPLPSFEDKVFYVWFEAPIGYISITADFLKENYKKWWQKDKETNVELTQFMGKDNIIFHSIICPASLLSTNTDWILPKHLAVTEYLKYNDQKFSKSNGIGIFGDACQTTGISVDVWRYYLLRNRPQTYDSQFVWSNFASVLSKQLIGNIGNAFNRILKYSHRNYKTKEQIPKLQKEGFIQIDNKMISQLQTHFQKHIQLMEKTQIKQSVQNLLETSNTINRYIQFSAYWANKDRTDLIVGLGLRVLKVFSLMLQPFIPATSAKINYLLGLSNDNPNDGIYIEINKNMIDYLQKCLQKSNGIRQPVLLFKQITPQQVQSYKIRFG